MKQNLLFLALFFSSFFLQHNAYAQTLQAGDIAFVGYHTDTDDGFTFIALKDIPAGEVIYFTDKGWNATDDTWYANTEDHIIWTAPVGGTSMGTVVSIIETSAGDVFSVSQGTAVLASGSDVFTLSAGDNIFAYQSSSGVEPASPTFIAGIYGDDNYAHTAGCDDAGGWLNCSTCTHLSGTCATTGTSTSGLPVDLTNGENAIALFPTSGEEDNAKYTGTLTGTVSDVRTAINNPDNWTTSDDPINIASTEYSGINITPDSPACTMTASISSQTDVACNGGATGSLTVTSTDGTAPYTYLWDDGTAQTTATATGLAAGTYEVTVTDANGCTATTSVEVTEPTTFVVSTIVTANVTCNGGATGTGSITLSGGTAPYTFTFGSTTYSNIPDGTTIPLGGLTAGTYNITATDANACTASSSMTITEPAALSANGVGTNESCAGNDGSINLTVVGGNSPYTYVWSNTATTEDLSGLAPGTYDVTVTDAKGCTATKSVTINAATACETIATVTTDAITIYTTSSFTVGGDVTDNGNVTVTERGIVYSTSANPTTADNTVQMGTGEGVFSQSVSGLSSGVTYYVRAYAINSEGTAYGNEVVFTAPYGVINLVHDATTTQYPTIQQAVDASVTGDMITLGAGTYIEQVTVTTGITIQGAGTAQTIVRSPLAADLTVNGGWKTLKAQDVVAVIGIKTDDASQVTIKDLTVDGFDQGYLPDGTYPDKEAYAFQGIGALNTNLIVDNVLVRGARELATDFGATLPTGYLPTDQPSGLNHNEAIFAESAVGAGSHTLEVKNSYIEKFQKTAILAWGPTLEVNIHDNTIQGYGQTLYSTGNGIQIASTDRTSLGGANGDRRGTTGIITNNQILGIGVVIPEPGQDGSYLTLGMYGPSAILPYEAGDNFVISNNTITRTPYQSWYNDHISNDGGFSNTAIAVYNSNNASVTGNTISGFDVAIAEEGAVNGSEFNASGNTVSDNRNDYFTAQNNDHIVLGESAETLTYYASSQGVDLIDNFGVGDRINVVGMEPGSINGELSGTLIVDFTSGTVTAGDGSTVPANSIQVQQNATTTTLFIDTDATEDQAELQLELTGLYELGNFKLDGGFIVFTVSPPTASAQAFCDAATVADLEATGTDLKWYDVATGGTALADNTDLSTGTYYVSQTVSGVESDRTSVAVTINPSPIASGVVDSNVSCNGGNDGGATASATGGTAPYTYVWSNAATTASIVGVAAGTYDVTITDANGCTDEASVIITEPAGLVASGVVDANVSCNGGSNGGATASATGGTAPYTYVWSNAATTASIVGVAAGTYDVTITDANGCTDEASVIITEPAGLVASGVVDANVSCNGGSNGGATASATGGTAPYTYVWSNAATTASIVGVAAGTYNVTITDANGCTDAASVTITEPAALSANITLDNNLTCSDDNNGGATVEVNGGTAPYTYEWDNHATTASVTNLTLGNHSVTITDNNGCTSTKTINIDFDDSTLPVPDVSTLPNISEYCEVNKADVPTPTATDNCSGTLMGTTSAIFPINTQGTTTITWTYEDEKGNEFTQQQDIIVKSSPLSDVSFSDATVTYDGTVHSIEVNGLPSGASASYQNNGQTDAGSYEVTATLNPGTSRCPSTTLTATLTIEKAEQTISFDEIPDKNLETDADFSLTATASSGLPVSYTYSYSADTPPAEVSETGEVSLLTSGTVEITAHQEGNANYPQATPVTRTLTIESSDATIHELTINGEVYDSPDNNIYYLIDCNNNIQSVEINLSSESNANSSESDDFIINTSAPGIYKKNIEITSQDGSQTENYNITIEKRFSYEDIIVRKFNNVLLINNNPETNGGYHFESFEWYKDGVLIGTDQYYSAGENSTDQLDLDANYSATMTTEEGDVLQTCDFIISKDNVFTMAVSPNPVSAGSSIDVITNFSTEMLDNMTIRVSRLYGTTVLETASGTNKSQINLPATMTSGTYIVTSTADGVKLTGKIIVK